MSEAQNLIEESSEFFKDFLLKKDDETEEIIDSILDLESLEVDSLPEKFSGESSEIATDPETDLKEASTHLLAMIEMNYNFSHELIPLDNLREQFLGDEAQFRSLVVTLLNPKLAKRGLPLYVLDPVEVKLLKAKSPLDPVFVLACNVILNPSDSRTFAARIKELEPLGVTSKTWTAWLKDPVKFKYAKSLFDEKFDTEVDIHADAAIARNVLNGDMNAIKFYKELTGRFQPVNQNATNVAAILMVLMEILAKHVKPEVIDVIANELEGSPVGELFSGRTVIG